MDECKHLQTAAVKTGFDLGLFRYFTEAGGPVTVEQIALETGAENAFLRKQDSAYHLFPEDGLTRSCQVAS